MYIYVAGVLRRRLFDWQIGQSRRPPISERRASEIPVQWVAALKRGFFGRPMAQRNNSANLSFLCI
jgi:hypothetical protein